VKAEQVPQEESMLEDKRRACYALDANGQYVIVPSKGWEVEKIVNAQANAEVMASIKKAQRDVLEGRASPLAYHMATRQMDVALLAANAGIWSLRVRRHLKPAIFNQLPQCLLQRYADALNLNVQQLRVVPPLSTPPCDNNA
jgi:hypothetical protein